MKHSKAFKLCAIAFALYLVLGVAFYFLAGESLYRTTDTELGISGSETTDRLTVGDNPEVPNTLTQAFICNFDTLDGLTFKLYVPESELASLVKAEILDDADNILRTVEFSTADIEKDFWGTSYAIGFESIENAKDRRFTLRLTCIEGTHENSVSFLYGNSVNAGKGSVTTTIDPSLALYQNGTMLTTKNGDACCLAFNITGSTLHILGPIYWIVYAALALLIGAYLIYLYIRHIKGKKTYCGSVAKSLYKYNFLIRQLVSRDFKTKYKRSVLGMFWSFLNPLLTMSVQYLVFSTIFSSDIDNFVVYLLTGIICYSFFTESTNMCLMSIIGNASLISKVYVPKYIYPFSRTLSSGINLLLSLIPLLICSLVTGNSITPAILLIPFGLLMLFFLSYGVGLILATLMVFFRDTQFLWGVATMLMMYLTPIFYPETIIPDQFMPVYRLNPLYHILKFMRSILIDGISPEPLTYLSCIVLCVIPFLIGIVVFRKNEDKFILNI